MCLHKYKETHEAKAYKDSYSHNGKDASVQFECLKKECFCRLNLAHMFQGSIPPCGSTGRWWNEVRYWGLYL